MQQHYPATDPDTTDFTFSLVLGNGTNDQHNSLFTVSGTQLLVNGTIDYETSPTLNIYVQVSDGNSTFSKALTINVNDINSPPTNISLSSTTVNENVTIGTTVGSLSTTDSDTSISSLTFSFTSSGDAQDDDNVSFTISGTTLLTSTTLDYETKTSYNIYINVNDGSNNYAKAFTVSVTNVLESPTDISFVMDNLVSDDLLIYLDSRNTIPILVQEPVGRI